MGEGTDAARTQVVTARQAVEDELERLEAAARAAVDVPAKIRRHPVRTAGVVAGTGFVLTGGPRRVLRGARNVILGRRAPLPKSMLPEEIDKALRELGDDGDRVRGTLERDFAAYVKAQGHANPARDLTRMRTLVLAGVLRPLIIRYGRQLIDQLLSADREDFNRRLAQVRARRAGGGPAAPGTGGPLSSAPPASGGTPPAGDKAR